MAKKNTGDGLTFPKGEHVWEQHHDKDGAVLYIVTSKGTDMHTADRNTYYVYERASDGWNKLGRGKSPAELIKKYVRI